MNTSFYIFERVAVLNRMLVLMLTLILTFMATVPTTANAAYRGEVAGWIPWWTAEEGIKSAIKQMDELDTIYPFVFEVYSDGSLHNRVDFDDDHWEDLFDEAEDERVDVIPAIAWFDGDQIHEVLSNSTLRKKHIAEIVAMVEDNDFDGVDIDYEDRYAKTKEYFSDFLKELEDELGRADLVCTIEARTPVADLYRTVPSQVNYSNDYDKIDRYCDRVQIMAYDQQRADLTLNDARRGVPYAPVADIDWVEKVLKLALEDIDNDKVMLGIPTYGRAWDVTVAPEWYRDYKSVAALNHPRIIELSEDVYDVPIGRSAGGEGVISYFPNTSPFAVFNTLEAPKGTPAGYEAAAVALYIATVTGLEIPVRFVSWSDASAVEEKLELAEKYDLEGISLFKIDGEEDQAIWRLF